MERDVLWGLFALQLGYIRQDALIAALQGWSLERSRSIRDILAERHALSTDRVTRIDEAVREASSSPAGGESISTVLTPAPPPSACRYLKVRLHRRGGLGEVYHAQDEELGRVVALKEIQDEWADKTESRERFRREAEVTGRLEHPGIVPVYGLGAYPDGRLFYAMRFVEGETLSEAIRRYHAEGAAGRDPAERAVAFRDLLGRFIDVCDAVAYAHSRGVIHRDIKPANVMLGPFGETLLVDWGLAKEVGRPTAETGGDSASTVQLPAGTRVGAWMGTPEYMSPEQASGRTDLMGTATDVYLLGAMLYEILTGRPPHTRKKRRGQGEQPPPDAPGPLWGLAERAMSDDPAGRQDAGGIAVEVREWLADEPVALFRDWVAELEELLARDPDNDGVRHQLARARVTLALVLTGLGRHADAAAAFAAAVEDLAGLLTRRQEKAALVAELATARTHLGQALGKAGRAEESKKALAEATEEFGHLQHLDPALFRASQASVMLTGIIRMKAPPPEEPRPGGEPATGIYHVEAGGKTIPPSEAPPHLGQVNLEEIFGEGSDRFSDLREIGRGGMSTVLSARDAQMRRIVALKIPSRHPRDQEILVFLREAQILAQLEHPNVIPLYGMGRQSEGGAPFLILRHMSGGSLADALRRRSGAGFERGWLLVFLAACRAVTFAHENGVIHGDPKPANVLLGPRGEVALCDWGLSEVTGAGVTLSAHLPTAFGREGQIVGTPAYMSPEAMQSRPLTPRSDVYSLGNTLFEVLTGQTAVDSRGTYLGAIEAVVEGRVRRVRDLAPSVHPALDAITVRAMAYRPEDRYPDVNALIRDVEGYLTGGPIAAYRESIFSRWTRYLWAGRREMTP